MAWLLSRQDAGRLISFLYPTIVVLLSLLFLRKRPAPREIAALFITYAGIALVVSDQVAGTPNDRLFVFGVLLCFANALSYAVYLVAGAELTQRIGANQFALIGGVSPVVTVFAAAFGLEEPVTILQVAGSVLVISGVLLVSLKQTS